MSLSLHPMTALTDMQAAFVENYVLKEMRQTEAARMAGFAHPSVQAVQLKELPGVAAAIAALRAEIAKANDVTKKKVIEGFKEAIDMARLKADPISMVAGWREIGKLCGFYEPAKIQIEVSHRGKIMVEKLNNMSDEELLQLVDSEEGQGVLEGEFIEISAASSGEEDSGEAPASEIYGDDSPELPAGVGP